MLVFRIFAGLATALHILIFFMESVWWMKPRIHRRFGVKTVEEAERLKLFLFNQGVYNLMLAAAGAAGVVLATSEAYGTVARTLGAYACGSMVVAALALVGSAPHMLRAAVIQGAAPLLALVGLWLT